MKHSNVPEKVNMRQILLDFPKQFKTGVTAAKNIGVSGRFSNLLICGMGGSALAADLLKIWLKAYHINLPLYIHRNYTLPNIADDSYLICCISYSGNTEETLSALKEARFNKLPVTAITSGGKMEKFCKKTGVPMAKIPAGFPSRMTLGYQFGALLQILVNCGVIQDHLASLKKLEKELHSQAQSLENRAKKMARKLKGKIPVIYASENIKGLARIWKINFNENSKVPSFFNAFPELNHNEMVGFTDPQKKFHAIVLADPEDHPRNAKRIKLTAEILKNKIGGVDIINLPRKDIWHKMFWTVLLAGWTSYHLALINKIDPVPVKLVEQFKKKLR